MKEIPDAYQIVKTTINVGELRNLKHFQ